MFDIMIVDDEPLVPLTIKSIVNWEEYDINIIFEASNGKEALKFLESNNVDIVVTDLNMPIMNGIELIENIKGSDIKVLVLSAYEDYELVRKAFKLGVQDYILKSDIDEDKLKGAILPMIEDMKRYKNKEGLYLFNESKVIKESLLKSFLDGGISLEEVENALGYKLEMFNKQYVVIYLLLDNSKEIEVKYKDDLSRFISIVLNYLKNLECGKAYEVLSFTFKDYAILYPLKNNSLLEINPEIINFIRRIKENANVYINISFSIGISDISSNLNDGERVLLEAKSCAEYKFVKGRNSITYFKEFSNKHKKSSIEILDKLNDFINILNGNEKDNINKNLQNLFKEIQEAEVDVDRLYGIYSELIFMINNFSKKYLDKSEIKIENTYEFVSSFETLRELELWVKKIVNDIVDVKLFNDGKKYSYTIIRALDFIDKNYYKEDMSIKVVSAYVELSENYFSVLFSNECGESFKDYLIKLRVYKAKELIEKSNLRIYEICEEVGYRNVEHFSRIFKKIIGISPNGYKNQKYNETSINSIKHHSR